MALDWNNIIVEDDENSQVQDTPVTILASGTPGSPISWDKLIIEEEETTVQGEDESVLIFASGVPGHSATIDGVTAETLPAGSEATVENIGTPDNARFHFGIPRGNTGEKGETGDKGNKGDKGDAGIGSAEYDAENERVIFNGVDENEVYTIDETDALLDEKLDAHDTELTGSILTFEAENDHAIKDLTVGIEPVQDLHGLPNPYPAGGGKNKYNPVEAQQNKWINTSTGAIESQDGYWITGFIPVKAGDVVRCTTKGTMRNAWYNADKTQSTYIGYNGVGLSGGSGITAPEDGFILIAAQTSTIAYDGNFVVTINSNDMAWTPYSNICPITGHSTATVTRTGKNLYKLAESYESHTYNNTVTYSDTGCVVEASGAYGRRGYCFPVVSGYRYTVSYKAYGTDANYKRIFYGTKNKAWGTMDDGYLGFQQLTDTSTSYSYSFTATSTDIFFFGIYVTSTSSSGSITVTDFQLELSSTATAYEPYQGTSVTIDFDGTRYGGSLNVLTGEMTVTKAGHIFDGTETWTNIDNRLGWKMPSDIKSISGSTTYNAIGSHYPARTTSQLWGGRQLANNLGVGTDQSSGSGYVFIIDTTHFVSGLNQISDFTNYLASQYSAGTPLFVVWNLATPITVQLTPEQLSSVIGQNHLWADTGDSTVTLRLPTGDLAYQDTVDYETQVTNKPDFASMLSGTEATMKATKNYSTGALIAVGDDLYKSLSAISSGATLTVGSNVTATTIEAELALKANTTDVTTALALKANSADVYTKTEVDALVESEITSYHDDEKATVITETASGSIVSITDGSPAPVTALKVTIEPVQDLHGLSNPYPAGGGKNLYNASALNSLSNNGITATVNNGAITLNGTATANAFFSVLNTGYQTGTYSWSFNNSATNEGVRISFRDTVGSYWAEYRCDIVNKTAKVTGEPDDLLLYVINGTVLSNFVVKPQFELGSTASSWTPYSNICPISGHTSATVKRTGKNFFPFTDFVGWSNGYLKSNGLPSGDTPSSPTYEKTSPFFRINGGQTYTFFNTFSTETSGGVSAYICFYDGNQNFVGTRTKNTGITSVITATAPSNAKFARVSMRTFDSAKEMQLELGSVPSSYEPYQAQQVNIDLGGTRYGGVIDVLAGEMVVTKVGITFTGAENITAQMIGNSRRFNLYNAPYSVKGGTGTYHKSSIYKESYHLLDTNNLDDAWWWSKQAIVWRDDSFESVEDMKTELARLYSAGTPFTVVGELTTPLTVQLTPSQMSTILGMNNIFADTGDTEVAYCADTKLYIQKLTKPTEDDMIANTNIAANTFFMVGNSLYFATSAIATGTTIVPGSNCTALSLADALNNLNA